MRKLGVFIFSLGLLCSSYDAHCFKAIGRIVKGVTKPIEHVVRGVGKGIEVVGKGVGKTAESVVRNGYKHAKKAGVSVGGQVNGNGTLNAVNVSAGKMANGQYVFNFSSDMQSSSTPVSKPPLFGDEVANWKVKQIAETEMAGLQESVRFHGFDTDEVKRSILQKGNQTLYRYQYNYTDFLLSGDGSDKGYSFKTGYKMPEKRTFFDNLKTDEERIASQSFIFEKTGLNWSFGLEFINGKEYHRAHCDGLRDILVPVGKRYIIWSMDRKLNPSSSFVSEMSKYMTQRENALKMETRPKRATSPEPVDTTYRKVCKVKNAVVNECVKTVVNSIPSAVKDGCKVCFQYLKKADDVSFNVVSTVVDVTLGNVVRGLDWLDKSAEMSGAGVRRYLRDGLGIDQATAQNIGDGLEVGMKMLISIVPAKTVNLASNASKRLVKLTPAGGPSNGFKFKFYDENVVYKEIKPTKGKVFSFKKDNIDIKWDPTLGKSGSGIVYENYIASLPEFKGYRLPPNFKTFDFWNQDRGIATSIKTLNTGATTYTKDPKQIYYKIRGYVNKTLDFKGDPKNVGFIDVSKIRTRNVHVGIPENTTARQMEEIMKAVDYGKLNNVNVIIRKVGK